MKEYLIETFLYNDITNKKLLEKIAQMPDKQVAVKLFGHLINSQYKWMARINQDPAAQQMSWWEPVYQENELAQEWANSLQHWLNYLDGQTESELNSEVTFTGYDGGKWVAKPVDIALQLNYHSIHHRAQIQTLIRQQGIEPDFVDYIGTKYRKLE